LSAITVAEIEAGIAKLRRAGSERRVEALQEWFARILDLYAERILAFDLPAARVAGSLADAAATGGHQPGFADIVTASTSISRQLGLTLNLRHFGPLGVEVLNPFEVYERGLPVQRE
jgi:predicted nucleic acid-binding protein